MVTGQFKQLKNSLEILILAGINISYTMVVLSSYLAIALALLTSILFAFLMLGKYAVYAFIAAVTGTLIGLPMHLAALKRLPQITSKQTPYQLQLFPWMELSGLVEASSLEIESSLIAALQGLPRFKSYQRSLKENKIAVVAYQSLGLAKWSWPSEIVEITWQPSATESMENQEELSRQWVVHMKSRVSLLNPSLLDQGRNRQNILLLLKGLEARLGIIIMEAP